MSAIGIAGHRRLPIIVFYGRIIYLRVRLRCRLGRARRCRRADARLN